MIRVIDQSLCSCSADPLVSSVLGWDDGWGPDITKRRAPYRRCGESARQGHDDCHGCDFDRHARERLLGEDRSCLHFVA
jgi:hypothetical protein